MEKTRVNFLKLKMVREKEVEYTFANINDPEYLYQICTDVLKMQEEAEEIMMLFTLGTKNNITGIFEVSRGSVNASIVHPREIFKRALLNNATSIVIAHNHPSGNPAPSNEDVNITKRIEESGELLGVKLLDHIVVGDGKYVSFKEKRMI